MEKYGKENENNFDKKKTYDWVEKTIKELEDKILELERANIKESVKSPTEPAKTEPESMSDSEPKNLEMIQEENAPKLPEEAPKIFVKNYESEKKENSTWGWIKERIKGVATFGFWEFHQAEKFRSQTKKESEEIAEEAKRIQQTEHLDYDVAYEEAVKIRGIAEDEDKSDSEDYEKFSQMITQEKMDENIKIIEEIMRNSVSSLEDKLKKYKTGSVKGKWFKGGGSAINAANIETYQANLKDELMKIQQGSLLGRGETSKQTKSEFFIKIIRQSLDNVWWRRYVYGGIEMVVDASLVKLIVSAGYMGATATKIATEKVAETAYTMKKGDTLWGIAKAALTKAGIANPTNAQIMAGAKSLAVANKVGVDIWGLGGMPLDTMMPIGYKVSMGALKAAIPKIAAMGGAV